MKMYNNVIKILDLSREKEVDILVARDMLYGNGNDTAISEAYDFIDKNYVVVTKCRRLKDNDSIKKLVSLYGKDDVAFKELCEKIKDRKLK